MSLLGKTWKVKNTDPSQSLFKKLLTNRGLIEEQDIARFLNPHAAEDFHDPFLMKDMKKAVERIGRAIDAKERIMIFGDYDVDGITGCAILMRALRKLGANVSYRLPHRIEDGYGLREKFIEEFKSLDVRVAITVDNGISSFAPVELAQSYGIDVIITDHHTIPEKIPNAYAILHPKLADSGYPFIELTGAGVALKLAQALLQQRMEKSEDEITYLLDLACTGTIADLGELRGENRYIVKEGLKMLEHTRWPGLSRLKEYAGIKGRMDTYDIGFLLGPRINAAGRMGHPKEALNLLLHDSLQTNALAENLEQLNRQRQTMMMELVKVSEPLAKKQATDALIIVHHASFHAGVIGLLASKLNEKYCRPAIVMEERKSSLVGSCRTYNDGESDSLNMVKALTKVKDLLTHFGGHAAAAGFEVPKKNLKEFIVRLKKIAEEESKHQKSSPLLVADCELDPSDISDKTVDMLESLAPFGVGNEVPRFICRNLSLLEYSVVGSDKKHLKVHAKINGVSLDCIAFKFGPYINEFKSAESFDVVCKLERQEWRGRKKLQLNILDVKLR